MFLTSLAIYPSTDNANFSVNIMISSIRTAEVSFLQQQLAKEQKILIGTHKYLLQPVENAKLKETYCPLLTQQKSNADVSCLTLLNLKALTYKETVMSIMLFTEEWEK
jgi:hypothetical protein